MYFCRSVWINKKIHKIEEKNELDDNEYGGFYTVVVKVDEEKVSEFISKIEDNYRISEYGYFGQEAEENEIIYTSFCEVIMEYVE